MLRSLVISSAFLALAACGGTISKNAQAFLDAAAPYCGPKASVELPDIRTCDAFVVYPDPERDMLHLSGVAVSPEGMVTAFTVWRNQNSGRIWAGDDLLLPGDFATHNGRVVGPQDADYVIIRARYLGLEGRPG